MFVNKYLRYMKFRRSLLLSLHVPFMGGVVASWLVRSSTDRAVRVRALACDTLLCSWARHFTLTVPLSTQEYKWVPVICWGNLTNCWGVTCDGLASRPGEVEILLAASCYGNRDKLRPDEPVGSIRLHFTFIKNLISVLLFCCYRRSQSPFVELLLVIFIFPGCNEKTVQ